MFRIASFWCLWTILVGIFMMPSMNVYAQTSTTSPASSHVLQQAMSTGDSIQILNNSEGHGFSLNGGVFSGRGSGLEPSDNSILGSLALNNLSSDHSSELEHDQRVYALLIDGSYDFNYDFGSGLPIHPYVNGGMGMAMADRSGSAASLMMQGGDTVPLFRLGGGVTYRLGEQWNLSVDYRTGFASSTGDQVFTGRGQQPVDLKVLNMGMRYKF